MLCRRMGLIHNGRLVAEGALDTLRQQTGRQRLSEVFLRLVGAEQAVFAKPGQEPGTPSFGGPPEPET